MKLRIKFLIILNIILLKNLINYLQNILKANLVSKTNFDNELVSFNRKTISDKTKYLEVLKN